MKPVFFLLLSALIVSAAPKVSLVRLPLHGRQPQTMTAQDGTTHIVFLAGKERASDVYYITRKNGRFSKPMQVNTIHGSAVAVGTIRGPHLALGKYGRVHVTWNGSQAGGGSPQHGSPMFYTRMRLDNRGFEKERNLMTWTTALDGGGSVAADGQGTVHVVWHAAPKDSPRGENVRGVYVATSDDAGTTFGKEQLISTSKGTCSCCGLKSFTDKNGQLYTLFRGAQNIVNRDMRLLTGFKPQQIRERIVGPWKIGQCVMSSAAFIESTNGMVGAWETESNIFVGRLDGKSDAYKIARTARQRHPALAVNAAGQTLVVWSENTGWKRGGRLAWELVNGKNFKPIQHGGQAGVPVWSLVAAYSLPNGDFEIIY